MQLIRKSDEDIQCGRVKEISSVEDLLRECSWCRGSSGVQIRFQKSFRRIRDNSKLVSELARKIKRLQADPLHVGGWLSGSLHFKKIHTDCKTVTAACRWAARGDRIIVTAGTVSCYCPSGDLMFLLNPKKHGSQKKQNCSDMREYTKKSRYDLIKVHPRKFPEKSMCDIKGMVEVIRSRFSDLFILYF